MVKPSAFCFHIKIIFFSEKGLYHLVPCLTKRQHRTNQLAGEAHHIVLVQLHSLKKCCVHTQPLPPNLQSKEESNTQDRSAMRERPCNGGRTRGRACGHISYNTPWYLSERFLKPSGEKATFRITQYNVPSARPALLSLQKETDEQTEQVKCLLTH